MTRLALVLLATTALASPALAQSWTGCPLEDGAIPAGCPQPNAGNVIARDVASNLEPPPPAPVGDLGFSISVDGVSVAGDTEAPPIIVAGDPAAAVAARNVDRMFDAAGIQVHYDGLGARPRLNVSTSDLRRSYPAGEEILFRSSTNYPAWIAGAEVRVRDRDTGRLVAALPIAPNGIAAWTMSEQGPGQLDYVLRVTDAAGRWDETLPLPLDRTDTRFPDPDLDGPVVAAGEGDDRTARRGIPVRGGAVTVSGQDVPAGTVITVMGEPVPLDIRRAFVIDRILPPGDHGIRVGVEQPGWRAQAMERLVTIPRAEWFATGLADLTIGRDLADGETYRTGRLAVFADGVLADGTRITGSVDTGERDWSDLLGTFERTSPEGVLADIEPDDVFVVTGDDSLIEDLAPSRDGIYLRVENGASHAMYGDFKAYGDPDLEVRTDRTLTGFEGVWATPGVTASGEPRARVTAYAAEPDTLAQRDVLRGTGGTVYVLSRQDIERGSETLLVQRRDPTSGRVLATERLSAGADYRIDYLQGLVLLTRPLGPSASGGGLVTEEPLGDDEISLVATYEYVPLDGSVDGLAAGGRAETWVGDGVRIGAAALLDDSGLADTRLLGLDLLLRRSEGTWLSAEVAESEGPGFGATTSLNGGLTLEDETSAGLVGEAAGSQRIEGRLDLADWGRDGFVAGYWDHKDAGFVSPDQNIEVGQQAAGLDGEVGLREGLALTFGTDLFEDDDGGRRDDLRAGVAVDLSPSLRAEAELATTDRADPGGTGKDDNGRRTDLGARLTWAPHEDVSYSVFGQATLDRSGDLGANHRLGFGLERRLSDALTLAGEASGGSVGPAAEARLAFSPNAGTSYSLGYRLDPTRALDSATVTGTDRGSLVFGADRAVSERLAYRTEQTYSAFGSEPSRNSLFGVSYTPRDAWQIDGSFLVGRAVEADGTTLDRRGLSMGVRHSLGEAGSSDLRFELRREDGDDPSGELDRWTVATVGRLERRTSEDWRLLGHVDLLYSRADEAVLDGRYAQVKLGYAYRPADHDRVNALVSYTFLYDMPGPDQVNVDGDTEGDRQRSHILNAAVTRDLNERWTLGAKYGFRLRDRAPREGGAFASSQAHLGILRLDYHVVHDWDLLVEGRVLRDVTEDVTDTGAMVGLYRHVGDNLRIGGGYEWGRVSDDLRTIEDDREGVFLNLVGAF